MPGKLNTDESKRIRFHVPVLVQPQGTKLLLAEPIWFPDLQVLNSNDQNLLRSLKVQLQRYLNREGPSTFLKGIPRSRPELIDFTVPFKAPQLGPRWRNDLTLTFNAAVWELASGVAAAYIPAVRSMAIAPRDDDFLNHLRDHVHGLLVAAQATTDLKALRHYEQKSSYQLKGVKVHLRAPTPKQQAREAKQEDTEKQSTLKQYVTDLSKTELLRAFARSREVAQLAEQLGGKFRRSVLLIGPSGVGKTAIFHQVIRDRLAHGLNERAFWSTSGSRILAGQSGFGMWQERCRELVREAQKQDAVVHFGSLLELVEAGRCSGQAGIISSLAGPIASGKLTAIVECTAEQRDLLLRRDPRLLNSFYVLHIEPPSPADLQTILLESAVQVPTPSRSCNGRRRGATKSATTRRVQQAAVEETPLPAILPEALQQIERLHRRFATYSAPPGRPLRFLRQLLADQSAKPEITASDVQAAFSKQTGLPLFLINQQLALDIDQIAKQLSAQVIGQPEVIETLVGLVATLKADLSRGDRPLASLLLVGPTGVGKTETAKALAQLFYRDPQRMLRLDMSEFSAPWAVSRLVGGFGQAGALTAPVRAQPFSVVLLDEFEKAHASVFDILLQVLGEGRLTDASGATADFRNTIVLMTSNLGVESFRSQGTGFGNSQRNEYAEHFERQVRTFLRPELYNRLDRLLAYRPLSTETLRAITRQQVEQIRRLDGLRLRDIELEIAPAAIDQLAELGHEPRYGARPLKRVVQRWVVTPLAEKLSGITNAWPLKIFVRAGEKHPMVDIEVLPQRERSSAESENQQLLDLIARAKKYRIYGQRLARAPRVLRLRNQASRLEDELRSLRKRFAPKNSSRHRLEVELEGELRKIQKTLQTVDRLTESTATLELGLLEQFYLKQAIDQPVWSQQLEQSHDELRSLLLELCSGAKLKNQTVTLSLLALDLSRIMPLIEGYLQAAEDHSLRVRGFWLAALETSTTPPDLLIQARTAQQEWTDPKESSGGNSKRPDRIGRKSRNGSTKNSKEFVGAFAIQKKTDYYRLPTSAVGVVLEIQGFAAGLRFESEAGNHIFRPVWAEDNRQDQRCVVEVYDGSIASYQIPPGLSQRKLAPAREQRRFYNESQEILRDDFLEADFAWTRKDHAQTIAQLLERGFERRIWDQLEDNP